MTTCHVHVVEGPHAGQTSVIELAFPQVPAVGEWVVLPNGRHGFVEGVTWDFTASTRSVVPVVRVSAPQPIARNEMAQIAFGGGGA